MESPIALAAIGLLLIATAGVFYTQTRSAASLGVLAMSVLLTAGAVTLERLWLTPTERVRASVYDLFEAIEGNDLPGVLRLISPTATDMRSDAETLMPKFEVQSAGEGGELVIELGKGSPPTTAQVRLKPLIKVKHVQSGAVAAYFDKLRLDFALSGDRWLLVGYLPAEDWREGESRLSR